MVRGTAAGAEYEIASRSGAVSIPQHCEGIRIANGFRELYPSRRGLARGRGRGRIREVIGGAGGGCGKCEKSRSPIADGARGGISAASAAAASFQSIRVQARKIAKDAGRGEGGRSSNARQLGSNVTAGYSVVTRIRTEGRTRTFE
ncbi:hypothetical protein AXG93_4773s1170 [Marchantia polymorpha subsp. ruderalis]|uniref:Uncharacterized protein n=1 Tax=Marchantia polymorpha subsp. ruderalis TaxID=1480154 RepID=A0A176WJV3_MARPO|nr:hypothetical protein AXG93_4773s1170 [Marchantia polymorpha subsp. ruderalis]